MAEHNGNSPAQTEKEAFPMENCIYLDCVCLDELSSSGKTRLKISSWESLSSENRTLRHYVEKTLDMAAIDERCREIALTLNQANRKGKISGEMLVRLEELGKVLNDEILPLRIKESLRKTSAEHLVISLDESLVQVPFELLHDGAGFLSTRFAMGRIVRTPQESGYYSRTRPPAKPFSMLILADPGGDLKSAYEEGICLRDTLDARSELARVSLRTGGITRDFVREKLRNFDLVHFAGHADYNWENPEKGGWRLTQGQLSPRDIVEMGGAGFMPSLVFSNACQSARTEGWRISNRFHDEIFGLANAFVLSGVRHYVGTFWEIPDAPGMEFALSFYESLFSGKTVGQAMKNARNTLIRIYGEETVHWAGYLLYGDPTYNYLVQAKDKTQSRTGAGETAYAEARLRTGEASPQEEEAGAGVYAKPGKGFYGKFFLLGLLFVLLCTWGYGRWIRVQYEELEKRMHVLYAEGKYAQAAKAASTLKEIAPDSGEADLLLGRIHLRKGETEPAKAAFIKAAHAEKASAKTRASAYMMLGRISSYENAPLLAEEYYEKAGLLDPFRAKAHLAQALVAEDAGNGEKALGILGRLLDDTTGAKGASGKNSDLVSARILSGEIRQRLDIESKLLPKSTGNRIDLLIRELEERVRQQKPQKTGDNQSSPSFPVTIWVRDFDIQGMGMYEGEARIFGLHLNRKLYESKFFTPVERAIFSLILEELKTGSGPLADPGHRLSPGRLTSAVLILAGRIVHGKQMMEITIRAIETETSEIIFAFSKSFPNELSPEIAAETVFTQLEKGLVKRLDPGNRQISR